MIIESLSQPEKRRKSTFLSHPIFWISVITALIVVVGIAFLAGRSSENSPSLQASASPIAFDKELNKTFMFPVEDSSGNQVTKIAYTITDISLQDQIILQGQPASAVSGKTFLIINLKLTNSANQTIQLNTRDYIRIHLDNSSELLAADIHNDPVQVQAISTKYTRLGFPINTKTKKVVLVIGEITGSKTEIPVSF